jgi:hypothetical protein
VEEFLPLLGGLLLGVRLLQLPVEAGITLSLKPAGEFGENVNPARGWRVLWLALLGR